MRVIEFPCHGCAHSASGEPYPGIPSGERPCLFCTRNPKQEAQLKEVRARLKPDAGGALPAFTARYDNGPTRKDVGDQYIATDRLFRDRDL